MSKQTLKGSTILLVEDEESLAIGLRYNLEEEGYKVNWVDNGKKALEVVEKSQFDLVILDVMLPYLDGFEVTKEIRSRTPQMPILMLTARTRIDDKLKGLELGVDDYMTKPFNLEELLLRLKGMLKRKLWYQNASDSEPIFKFNGFEINFENLSCKTGSQTIQFTHREAMVLKYLIDNKGKIISREELLENVWGISSSIETRTVDNFISRLRKYFEADPAHPVFIKSIRSAGYIFTDSSS
jgi:DNA-binding response OmpR family regulator